MLRWFGRHRLRPLLYPLLDTFSTPFITYTAVAHLHSSTDFGASAPTTSENLTPQPLSSLAVFKSPKEGSASFLTDPKIERAQNRWRHESRTSRATLSLKNSLPLTRARQGTKGVTSPTLTSPKTQPVLLQRIMSAKNKVAVWHPTGSQTVTLQLSIELPSPSPSHVPTNETKSPPSSAVLSGSAITITKCMVREESEMAAKTLDRIRLLFAPPRRAGSSSQKVSKEQILEGCPRVRVLRRTSECTTLVEGQEPPVAAEASVPVLLPTPEGLVSYTELNRELPNSVFWKLAEVLCVGEVVVQVLYNVPTIVSVASPGAPYVGLPLVCSNVSLLFANDENVFYEWCVFSERVPGTHSRPTSTPRVVGTSRTFTPTEDLLGDSLMLRVSLDPNAGVWSELRLPHVVQQLPPPVARWQKTLMNVEYPALRVVTYNILYDDFCTSNSSKAKIYPFASDEVLDLENRKIRLVQELLAYHADLVCLQECGRDVFQSYLLPVLQACGYDGWYCNKAGLVKEGCAFLYRTSRFELIASASIPLNLTTLSSLFPTLAERVGTCAELKEALAAVTTIGAYVVLRERTKGQEVVVGNTHLFYHANACHIRILQAYMLLHWLYSTAVVPSGTTGSADSSGVSPASPAATPTVPSSPHLRSLVLCGDFNCTHPTGAYRLLTTGQVEENHPSWDKGELFWWGCARLLGYDAEHLEELLGKEATLPQTTVARKDAKRPKKPSAQSVPLSEAPTGITDASIEGVSKSNDAGEQHVVTKVFREALHGPLLRLQDAYQRTDPSLPWTNYTLTFREVIDYIFFSEDSIEVLRTIPIPPESELAENFALPNSKYPSDHVALVADLAFRTR